MNLTSSEQVQFVVFIAVMLCVLLLEIKYSTRDLPKVEKYDRWFFNLSLFVVATLFIQVSLPLSVFALTAWAKDNDFGLISLHNYSLLVNVSVFVLCVDFLLYLMHRLYHKHPLLWKIHAAHHSDTSVDFSTALRFHPFEFLLTTLAVSALVVALSPAIEAVLGYFILHAISTFFTHGNFLLSNGIARVVGFVFVTPNQHTLHHSLVRIQANTNYGIVLSIWDRMFKTLSVFPTDVLVKVAHGIKSQPLLNPSRLISVFFYPFKMVQKRAANEKDVDVSK